MDSLHRLQQCGVAWRGVRGECWTGSQGLESSSQILRQRDEGSQGPCPKKRQDGTEEVGRSFLVSVYLTSAEPLPAEDHMSQDLLSLRKTLRENRVPEGKGHSLNSAHLSHPHPQPLAHWQYVKGEENDQVSPKTLVTHPGLWPEKGLRKLRSFV